MPLPQAFGPSQQCQTGRGKEWYSPHWDAAASPHQSLSSTGIANPFPLIPLEAFQHLEYYLKCQTILSAFISLNIWDFNCSELLTVTGSEEPTHNLSLQGEARLLLPYTEPVWSTKCSVITWIAGSTYFSSSSRLFGMFSHVKCAQIKHLMRSNVSSETNPNVIYKLCRWNDFKDSIFQGAGKEAAMKLRTGRYFSHPKSGQSLHCIGTNKPVDLPNAPQQVCCAKTHTKWSFCCSFGFVFFLFFEGKLEK